MQQLAVSAWFLVATCNATLESAAVGVDHVRAGHWTQIARPYCCTGPLMASVTVVQQQLHAMCIDKSGAKPMAAAAAAAAAAETGSVV